MFETITVVVMAGLILAACIWGWWIENHGSDYNDSEADSSDMSEKMDNKS